MKKNEETGITRIKTDGTDEHGSEKEMRNDKKEGWVEN